MIELIVAGLVPAVGGIITWVWFISKSQVIHSAKHEQHTDELKRLREDLDKTDDKYMEIIKMLMEIKVEVQNKVNRKD